MRTIRAATRSRCHARTFGHSRFVSSADISAVRQSCVIPPLSRCSRKNFQVSAAVRAGNRNRDIGDTPPPRSLSSRVIHCSPSASVRFVTMGGGRVRHISHKSARDITQRRRRADDLVRKVRASAKNASFAQRAC
jgi:hypothetical protein